MTMRQRAIQRTTVQGSKGDVSRIVRTGFSRTRMWLDRAMLGGATPRGYRREGFPEITLHQLMSGRKDRM